MLDRYTPRAVPRRERELLSRVSPVKIAIIKAWTGVGARRVEAMIYTIFAYVLPFSSF